MRTSVLTDIPVSRSETEERSPAFQGWVGIGKKSESRRDGRAKHCRVSKITENRERSSYGSKMAHTHTCNLLHCVFSTKDRANLISDPARLWEYTGGIARQKQIVLLAAGGTANHLHLLISLPPTVTLAKAVQELKGKYVALAQRSVAPFAWQQGYSAFSVSQSQRQRVIDYIDGQTEHHAKWTFEQEFMTLLKKSGVPYDPRFVFG